MASDFGKLCKCLHLFETTFLLLLIPRFFLFMLLLLFLFFQILTRFLFKFLLSVVANFLALALALTSASNSSVVICWLPPRFQLARFSCFSWRTFLPNQQTLPLSTELVVPRSEQHFYFFYQFFPISGAVDFVTEQCH